MNRIKPQELIKSHDSIDNLLHGWLREILAMDIFPKEIKGNVLIQTPSIFDDFHKEPGQRLAFDYYLHHRLSPLDGLQFSMDEGYFINISMSRNSLLHCVDFPLFQEKAFDELVKQIIKKMTLVQSEIWNEWIFIVTQNQLYDYPDFQAMESMNECFNQLRYLFPLMVDLRQMPELLDEEYLIKRVDGFDHAWKKIHEWHITLNKKDLMTFCHEESPKEILQKISTKIIEQILQQYYHAEKINHENI